MSTVLYIERESLDIQEEYVPSGNIMKWLYNTTLGKASLHLLVKRKIFSMLGGWYMDSSLSQKQIVKFIQKYDIDMSAYHTTETKSFNSFNDFFYRKIKPDKRPIGNALVSPSDGKILAFKSINHLTSFFIKGSEFSINNFIPDKNIINKYKDGSMVIIRLAPTDYHRFHFPANGFITKSEKIKGKYFSVSPLALKKNLEIFCQNHREYSTLKTKEYGDILISEVGATMVGSIIQTYSKNSYIKKGEEKGLFAFGGSTVVLFFEKGKVNIDHDLLTNTQNGIETSIKMGENIAC